MIENTEELLGQIVPSGSVVGAMLTEKGDKGDRGDTGETGNDGFSPIITTSKQGKVTTLTIVDAEGTKTATINDGADGSGSGDMLKSTYDANENGIVDNAEKVNNHTVLSDVPANAVFTDTTYTAGTGIDITNGVISNTQTSAEWGNISGDITDQSDLQSALSDKANTSDLAAVATSGSYNDLTNKPTIPTVNNATLTIQKNSTTLDTFTANASVDKTVNISVPTKVSDLSNDSGFITNSVNNLTNYTTTSTLNTLLASKEKDIPIQNTAPASPEEDDLWIDTSEPEEMQEAIKNEYSTSTTDTYSCNYVNGIIASEGNANGYYTKYSDGTLICRYYVGPLTINANSGATQAVTFPTSFIDTNWQCMIQLTNGQNYWSWIATAVKSKSASGFTLDIWNNSEGQCPGQYFDYIAIGRWK